MVTIQDYLKSTMLFVNSLTIKIDEIRKHQDYHLYVKYGNDPMVLEESKYYQNITGVKNKVDPTPTITLPGQLTPVELNRAVLDANPLVKRELLTYGDYFNQTCKENPGMNDYVRGCLTTIDMPTLVQTDNYRILHYKESYLSSNEGEIIWQLEQFIGRYMVRYHNIKYLIDELYLPGVMNNLYNALFMQALLLKLKNILTNKVDIFHLGNFMMSYKHIYQYLDIFDLPTNIWLYGNIRRLKYYTGKNDTLHEILYDVFDRNMYGIAKLDLENKAPTLIEDAYERLSDEYYHKEIVFNTRKANDTAYNIIDKDYNLERINELYIENNLTADIKTANIENYYKSILNSDIDESFTKTFIIDQPEYIKTTYHNNFIVATSNIVHMIRTGQLDFTIDYYNPTDSRLYKLKPADVENIVAYNLYHMSLATTDDFSIVFGGIYTDALDMNTILGKTWYKDKIDRVYEYLTDDPSLGIPITSVATVQEKIAAIRGIEKKAWYLLSNSVDLTLRNDIRVVVSGVVEDRRYEYVYADVLAYMNDNNLIGFMNEDYREEILIDLLEYISGLTFDKIETVLERFRKLVAVFHRTTSYTVNLIMDMDFKDEIVSNHFKNSINLGYKSYMEVKEATYRLYEEATTVIDGLGFIDTLRVKDTDDYPVIVPARVGKIPIHAVKDDVYNEFTILGSMFRIPNYYQTNGVQSLNMIDDYIETLDDGNIIRHSALDYTKTLVVETNVISEQPIVVKTDIAYHRNAKTPLPAGYQVDHNLDQLDIAGTENAIATATPVAPTTVGSRTETVEQLLPEANQETLPSS